MEVTIELSDLIEYATLFHNLMQKKKEIQALVEFLSPFEPKRILEIGTAAGGTLYIFSRAFKPEILISIDLPRGPFGGGYSEERKALYESYGNIKLIRDDSHKVETQVKVEKILNSKKLDLLFIDGDHTYDGVRKDFEMYHWFVKEGGIIAFHDINEQGDSRCNVRDFWNKLKLEYETKEIIIDPEQLGCGIGILFYNRKI